MIVEFKEKPGKKYEVQDEHVEEIFNTMKKAIVDKFESIKHEHRDFVVSVMALSVLSSELNQLLVDTIGTEEIIKLSKAIEFKAGGIKCDNEECDYNDMTVKYEDYKLWVNKPCPKCGQNLLTQQDYDSFMLLIGITEVMNSTMPAPTKGEPMGTMTVNFHGTGELDIKIKED